MTSSTEFDFSDLSIIEIPVTGPDKQKYILREPDSTVVRDFKNRQMACTKFVDGKIAGVQNAAGLEHELLAKCLFRVMPDGSVGGLIDQRVLEKWSNRVVSPLFDKAKDICGLTNGSPWVKALERALGTPGAPCTLAKFKLWIGSLMGADVEPLKEFVTEDELKNLQSSTTDGSV